MSTAEPPAVHDKMKPFSWLLGKWHGVGHGKYPTIKDFQYEETIEFFHVGQPNFQFTFYACHPDTKKPLHREVGFLRVGPSNKVALVIAQNLGLCEMEEGSYEGQEIKTESHTVGRLTFGIDPETKKISRILRKKGGKLEQIVSMETSKTPMTQHLEITYSKIE